MFCVYYHTFVCDWFSYDIMRRCWLYSPRHRPSFFDILQDFEPDMSDRFREMSFYYNQDAGETASVSDENGCDVADDLETDRLTKPLSDVAPSCSNRSSSSTPKSVHRTSHSRDCLPGNSRDTELADSIKPQSASTSRGTDRPPGTSDTDNIVLSDIARSSSLPLRNQWNGGDASSSVPTTVDAESDSVRPKGTLINGHIPYNFVTTARC